MNPDFTLIWPLSCLKDGDHLSELISLQLNDCEVAQHPLVEALRRCRGPLEPSRDGMAGMARAPGGRRNAHTLDAQARDLVAFPTSAAKAAVRCPRVRADRSPADRAAVPPASAPLRRKRAGAHDGEAQCSTGVTPALGAGHPVDRVHRSSVPGGNPRFSPTISEVKATDQQRPAQAPHPDGMVSNRLRADIRVRLVSAGFVWLVQLPAIRFRTRGFLGLPWPDADVLGIGDGADHGLLIDSDIGRRIAWPKQQCSALLDVVALLDAAPNAANEDVVADQHRQRGIAPKLIAQRQRGDLPFLERCAVTHIGRSVRLVLGKA